jgi:Fe-S-cluster-containing dehydrogenase component
LSDYRSRDQTRAQSQSSFPESDTPARPRAHPRPLPGEDLETRPAIETVRPGFVVDLRRCIGCHACSVACKTAHEIPLGEFPLRVRWLPRPETQTYAFVPTFSESLCSSDPESTEAGLEPACVRACPTDALVFGDFDASKRDGPVASLRREHETTRLEGPHLSDSKRDVVYVGLESFVSSEINLGAALDPRDADPIYEQKQ